ncbi:FtsX-like permease family protein [compost metagenome]
MLLAKDLAQIALMRSIGFTIKDITVQYVMRMLPVAGLGIVIGVIAAGTLGQSLVRVPAALMGAPQIQLVIHPAAAYLLLPIVFFLIAGITTLGMTRSINTSSIVKGIAD